MARFKGKRILITGGTSGIGLAAAQRILAEEGTVVLTGSREESVRRTREQLPGAIVLRNDAGEPGAAARLAGVSQRRDRSLRAARAGDGRLIRRALRGERARAALANPRARAAAQ